MKSVVREKGRRGEMCLRCRNEVLPKQFGSAIAGMVLRAPAKGMLKAIDAGAEKVRRRKSKTNMTRKTFSLTMRLYCSGADAILPAYSEECPDCLKLNAA